MPDLNLTESEKRIFTDSEAPKTIKPFAEWSGENESPSDDPQSFLNYADFVRNELGDSYDARSEQDIQVGLRQGLSLVEGMTEESIEQSLAPKESDFDTKLNVVFSSLGVKDPDRLVLLDYQSGAQVLSEQPDVAEEYRLKVDSMREQAEVVVNNRLDQTKEELVYSNQLPFAFVQAEGGSRKLLVSDIASKMSLQKAIKASQLGGVSFNPEDVSIIQSNLQVIPDTGVTIYKTKELMEISKGIIELSKNDESVADFVDGASLQMAREKDTTAESVSRSFGDNVSEFLGAIGVADAEIDEKRERIRYASGRDVDDTVEYITDRLNKSGASYKPSDVRDAYESLVVQNGFSKGVFTLRSEGKEVSENVINTKLGAQINPAVFVNDELFEKSILMHPELSAETKKLFVSSRKLVLDDQFDNYSKVLDDSSYADEWSEALLRGRQAGKEDAKILTEFTADKEVFSELGARTSGIAASVWDSVASLVYLAPAVFKFDWGKEGLQGIAKDQSNRRQIAQMFGANFGVGQDVMEAIAPMIVDIGATYLLSTATAGAGGAAYLSAKSGARLTTSGMIKGITSNVLRSGLGDAAESVAKTALARGLIRGNLGDATEAIRAYNNVVAQKMGLAVGTFVPAASRSAAMSYGSLYNQLKANDPNMSDEEAHDRAMGFAMTGGVATGIITSAFSAIGRGGVEDALLKGMNFREAKSVLGALANTGGITDESLKSAMGQVLRDSLKKHSGQFLKTGRKIAKNGIDESMEEGIDQLVNSYIEDVGLDQSTPLAEKWNQTVHAAMVGGVLGAGVPAIQAGASRVGVTPTDRLAQNFKLREQYIQDVAANLKESGSPITAEVVSQVINQRKRTMPTAPPAAPPTEPVVDEKAQTQISFDTAKQELIALQQEQEQLDSIGEPDEAQVVRIGELNALVAEKENEVIVFTDTLQSLAAQDGEFIAEAPKKELDLLKELEGVSPEEVKYRVERLRNKNSAGKAAEIPESKSYARRVSRDKIQFDTAPSTSENALIIQRKATDLAGMGYPQQITYKEDFDLPIYNDADAAAFSDYVASVAYTIYPTVKVKEPYGGSVFQSPTKKESFDPTTGKRGVVAGFLDENGSGVFDNNPVVVAEMLRANVPVSVPKNFALSSLNPSIIVDPDNNVVDVVAPSSDSNVLESKVASLEENRELYYNNVEASRLEAIPFKSVELPDGVARFDTANGATIEGNFQTVAQIKNSLNAFLSELQKTGDERNIEAHSRMAPLSNTEDTEAQLQAFIDAREKFVFNARMFELRGALQQDPTDKVGKFLSRVNLKKEAAAKRVLPLISIDKAGDLSNDEIIEIFVDQYAVNNTALSGNTPPSFASVLSDSTRNFAVQKDYIDNRHRADANATLPVDEGDITDIARKQSDFIDNFGRKPDGEVAAPEDVAAMMVASIDKAIEAINSDQKLRVTVEDFVSDNVFDGSLQMQEITRSLNPKDLFGFLSSWVVSSNGRVRSSMSDFVSTLESGDLFRGIDLRDALIATRFTTRPDGLGISNKSAVDEFQSLFADFTGELLTAAQARNTMLAIDGALRTRLSKAKITDNRRAEITEQNDAAIIKLGLKSGDPASVVKALKNVAKGMGNKNEQLVAKLLLEDTDFIQNNVRFVIGGGSIDIAGKYIKAINGNHIVFINRTSGSGRGLINTLLEEYVHAFTSDTVAATDTALSKNKGKASARLKLEKIFSSISRNYDAEVAAGSIPNSVVAEGLGNLDEFIAKFFLVDGFQKYVKDIVGPNAFDGIIDSIVTIFPKVTPSEKSSYVSAFKDVLDLGKRGRKHTTPDAKAIGSSAADSILFSAPIKSEAATAQDAAYLATVESGDLEAAQRMVNDAAKVMGYDLRGFHSTTAPKFTNFSRAKRGNRTNAESARKGFFFSASTDTSKAYFINHDDIPTNLTAGEKASLLTIAESTPEIGAALLDKSVSAYSKYGPPSAMALSEALDVLSSLRRAQKAALSLGIDFRVETKLPSDQTLPVFLRMVNPLEKDFEGKSYRDETYSAVMDRAVANGNDGVILSNTWDGGELFTTPQKSYFDEIGRLKKRHASDKDSDAYWRAVDKLGPLTSRFDTIYAVFSPSQIKSADPVTYDESGNVIPLSQRFDDKKSSILYAAPIGSQPTVSPDILEGVPEAQRGLVSRGIKLIQSITPPSISIKAAEIDTGGSLAYVSKDESTIFINLGVLANILGGRDFDSLSAKNIIGVLINEEIAHVAGFNALTQEEVDSYTESLSDSDYQKIITEYTQNSPDSAAEALRSALSSEDADAVLTVKRQLAEEKLRMHLQKVTRGSTTEEDARFWKSKPSLFAMLKRYLAGALRRFAANRKPLGGAGGAALNKMINEMRAIEAGFVRQPNSLKFDPKNPEAVYQMLVNGTKGIEDVLSSAPIGGMTGDYAPIVDLLEVPEVEFDRFGKPKNGLLDFANRIFAGEIPEAFRRIIENRNFFKTAVAGDVAKFKKAMDKLVIATYGSFENAPMDLIATAQGSAFQSLVSEENLEQIEDAYEASLDDIDARLESKEIDTVTARDERKMILALKTEKVDQAYAEGLKKAEEGRDAALRKVALDSPEMAAFIIDIRQRYIIPMQQKLIASGLGRDIELKIASTGEVYLTRAYRMFTDSTYLDNIEADENWPDKRDAALQFFRKQFVRDNARDTREELRSEGTLITYQEAKQMAKRNLDRKNEANPSRSYEQEALDTFLESYGPNAAKSSGSSDSGIRMAMDNLKNRKDLPKAIRDLLGEYDAKTGTDLILRTYSTVANIAAQKTFLERLKLTAEKAGLMVTSETRMASAENQKKYANWVPVRPDNFAGKVDPLSDMYIHPEFKGALDMTLNNSYVQEYADTSERVINGVFTLASKLSGKSMAFKTLGSVGFYFRNAIGNFIFGTAQGFFRYDKMFVGMTKASVDAILGTNGGVDPTVTELIGLGVMGDEIRSGVLRDLLNGKQTPAGIQKELENLMDKSQINKPAKVLAAIEKKAQDLSAALDAAYKVVYFQHELAYIERSVAEGGESSLYGKMSPTQRKREAARKVLMTAQSYSQAPPIVTDFTKSPLGLMFAPFLRFKAEMFRIPFNTYKLGLEEIRSGDPVMRQRGMFRMLSMTGVLGILSSALPMIMASVSGIGDEENEDEAIRESLQEYLRGHTFYYFYLGGKLKSFDATYLNPFAGTVDPILRSLEKIQQGKYSEAGAAFALGYIKDQFLDTQILANAAINAANNTDQSTGKPIWNRGVDEPIDVATKLFNYVAAEAYAPRIGKDFVKGLETQSLSGMLGALGSGAAPARIYDVDLQRGFERFLLDHNKRFADVKSELGKLRSGQPMSDETIRETIDDNIEARRRMNYELMRVARGFSSLGLGADNVISTMHDRGIGKQRTKLLSYGFMDRPPINLIAESLLQERSKEFGPARLQKIVEYYQTKNRYIQVSPVTETD